HPPAYDRTVAVCDVLTDRARYEPATGGPGRPVAGRPAHSGEARGEALASRRRPGGGAWAQSRRRLATRPRAQTARCARLRLIGRVGAGGVRMPDLYQDRLAAGRGATIAGRLDR